MSGHRQGALLGALIALLALAAPASASNDPLGSGTTKLTLDRGFFALMKENGVRLVAKGPAAVRKGKVASLPVSGGGMDPLTGKGEIDQEGVLIFRRGSLSLPFRRVMVKTKSAPLHAKVGGSQLKIATGARIVTKRAGFGTVFTAKKMKLSDKLATRLNKKLHLGDVFEAGQLLGSLRSRTQPQTIAILATGRATLTPDPETFAKLNNLFVSYNPISPAELAPGPVFTLPMVREGAIAPDASRGTLRTGGAIELLKLHGGQIFWQDLRFTLDARVVSADVNVQPSPPYAGKQEQVPTLDLDTSVAAVSSDPKARTITLANAPLRLQAQSAAYFNQVFAEGKPTFMAGDVFGTISFTAQAQ